MNRGPKMVATFTVALMLVGMSPMNFALATTNDSSSVSPQATSCETAVAATYAALDLPLAISNAMNSQAYAQWATSYRNTSYYSAFQIDKTIAPYPACTEEVLSYNIVFALHNTTGVWAGYLVVTENQALLVIGSQVQSQGITAQSYSENWAGYTVSANSGATSAVYEAVSYFTQPTASYPPTGCANSNSCIVSTWVGLSDQSGAGNKHLAQDGTIATCVNSGCTPTYFAWYEMLPANWVQCTSSNGGSVSIRGGDSIWAWTTNEAQTGGSSTLYDFYIYDYNSGTSCYVSGQSYTAMSSPTYGQFILENAEYGSGSNYDSLAKFSTSSFSGAGIGTGGGNEGSIYNYYPTGFDMENSNWNGNNGHCVGNPIVNVYTGALSSGGAFTETWNSSLYTPVYITGC